MKPILINTFRQALKCSIDWDIQLLGSLPTNLLHALVEMCQIVGTVENISGRDWMSEFMSCHKNICLRSPEATSIGFN